MPKFLLVGNGPYFNRGCEAITRGTTKIIRDAIGQAEFVSIDFGGGYSFQETDPDILHRPISITRFSKMWFVQNFLRTIGSSRTWLPEIGNHISECDAVLALGGDNFTMDYGSLRAHLSVIDYVNSYDRPLVIWAASMGPFDKKGPKYEQTVAKKLKICSAILVREKMTQEYLASIGVEDNVRYVTDPAFVMDPIRPKSIGISADTLGNSIGLNFSPLMAKYLTSGNIQATIDLVIEVVGGLLAKYNRPIILIPHVFKKGNSDYELLSKVFQEFKSNSQVFLLSEELSAKEIKWVISRVRCFLGSRTHSTIAALSSSVPTLSLAYSMKANGINRDIFGHSDYVVFPQSLSPQIIIDKVGLLLQKRSEIHEYLENKMPVMKKSAFLSGKYLREIMDHGQLIS